MSEESLDKVLMVDQFLLYGSGKEISVCLFSTCLKYRPIGRASKEKIILMTDVIGVQCMKGKSNADSMAYLTLYTYPRGRTLTGNPDPHRHRCVFVFVISKSHVFPENLQICQLWRSAILNLIRPAGISSPYSGIWMIVINPAGGQGKAQKIFREKVLPIFAEAEIQYEIVVSERAGHITQLTTSLDLDKYSALIIISGDGLIHEAINGLMHRADWERAIKLPLGIIPGGSGNALAASIHEACGEPFFKDFPKHAALMLAQATPIPLDLLFLESLFEQRYGFLSVGWGLMADIDIESEKFRNLGESRFTVGALQRLMDLRTYSGTLSYLPVENVGDGDFACIPPAFLTSGDLKPNAHLLVPLSDPVPSNWKIVDGDFISIYLVSISRLAVNSVGVPWAKLSDGLIYLFWMKSGAPKTAVITFLVNLSTGEHLNSPYVQIAAARAFRLEPREKDGILTVDGERIKYGPIQGQVLPSLARVFSKRIPSVNAQI